MLPRRRQYVVSFTSLVISFCVICAICVTTTSQEHIVTLCTIPSTLVLRFFNLQDGWTALSAAARNGHLKCVKLLIGHMYQSDIEMKTCVRSTNVFRLLHVLVHTRSGALRDENAIRPLRTYFIG